MDEELSMANSTVEVIREELRHAASMERKKHRATILNQNRVALGEYRRNDSVTPEYIIASAKALKKKPLPISDYTLLQNALIEQEENVNTFLNVDNILFSLVRDLSGNNPDAQLAAASCCCNIALCNAKACNALTKRIGSYLIGQLESLNSPLLEVCIWTIGNLITGNPKSSQIFHAQGIMKYLITLMQDCDNSILPSVTYAALHCVFSHRHKLSNNDLNELVQATVKRAALGQDPNFLWLLAILSSVTSSTYLCNILPIVIEYLYNSTSHESPDFVEVTAMIRILANTIPDVSEDSLTMLNEKVLQHLEWALTKLLQSSYLHIKKETLWLIGNLYNHPLKDIHKVAQNIVPLLSSLKESIMCIG